MNESSRITRRTLLAAGAALASAPLTGLGARGQGSRSFPDKFLWGAATAGHQVEGNNLGSDLWLLENLEPTVFAEPSGDACNHFELWPTDLDLVRDLGLNSYRFSIEWARIEPEPGLISVAMLDHYKAVIEGCIERGLEPIVTFNHFTTPRWFAAQGGWTNARAPDVFARYCERAARHLASGIRYALTINEPNLLLLLKSFGLPPPVWEASKAALQAAARAANSTRFNAANVAGLEDIPKIVAGQVAGHRAARAAIKAVRPDLPVGLSLAIVDDQAVGRNSLRDRVRKELYERFLELAAEDDFIGVQNYDRKRWDDQGSLPPPAGATLNYMGHEVYAPSLAGAVRYAHDAAGVPVLVTEHGVGIDDDNVRAAFIPAALSELKAAIDDGVPVLGYTHWSLFDNFEWVFGYRPKFGLVAVDRQTFERRPKPSARVLGEIARRNAL